MTENEAQTRNKDVAADSFPSLASLRAVHRHLLKRLRQSGDVSTLLPEVESFIRQGRATGVILDADRDRGDSQSSLDYWATMLYRAGYEAPDATLDEFDPTLAPELSESLCPYMGLDAFRENNRDFFFGRQRFTEKLIDRLKQNPFLAVIGSSGSGKSSVVMGGLIPALKSGALPGSQDWRYLPSMVPGSDPLENLARMLRQAGIAPLNRSDNHVKHLLQQDDYLSRVLGGPREAPAVMVVDQFEEIFTLCNDDTTRQAFVKNLLTLAQSPDLGHKVILTMRSDYETHITRLRLLHPVFVQSQERVNPLDANELREAIEGPAELAGLRFEEGVVDGLIQDVLGEPAGLPLLQFTLLKLWENRDRNRVTLEIYKRLGGGRLALARSADALYEGMIVEDQNTLKRILLRMVRPGDGLEVMSSRILVSMLDRAGEAPDRVRRVLDRLIEQRLVRLTKNEEPANDQVEVAHEALVRNWPRLVDWLEEERAAITMRKRLEIKAKEWVRLGRKSSGLLDEAQLLETQRWLESEEAAYLGYDDALPSLVEASRAAIEQNEREREQARQSALVQAKALAEEKSKAVTYFRLLVIALLLLFVLLGAMFFLSTKRNAEEALVRSSQLLAAQSISLLDSQPDLALLLSVEAGQTVASFDARNSLLQGLNHSSKITAFLHGHKEPVTTVAFSPAGKMLASVSFKPLERGALASDQSENDFAGSSQPTNYIILWDVETYNQIKTLESQTDRISSLAFSPDGKILASGTDDNNIILWDVVSGARLGEPLAGESDSINSLAFSVDGKILAAGTDNGFIKLWDIATRKTVGDLLHDDKYSVKSVVFSPDGMTLASGGLDIVLWDTRTWKRRKEIPSNAPPITGLAFGPDGSMLVSSNFGESPPYSSESFLIGWDLATGKQSKSQVIGPDHVTSVAFAKDGKTVATGSQRKVILWDIETGLTTLLNGHSDLVNSLAFGGPNGNLLASAGDDKRVILWDVSAPPPLASPLNDFDKEEVHSVAFSPNGDMLGLGSWPKGVTLWDIKNGKEKWLHPLNAAVNGIAFSPNGRILATGTTDQVILLDVETGAQLGEPLKGHMDRVICVAFSPDGKLLASGGRDNRVVLWNIAGGQPSNQSAERHTSWVTSLAFCPNGTLLASGSADGAIILWDVPAGKQHATFSGHKDSVTAVAFSPDGKSLLSGSADKSIMLWNVSSRQSKLLATHEAALLSLTLSPDGKMLASGDEDKNVTLWSVLDESDEGLQKLGSLTGHNNAIYSIAFSPDGKMLASGSEARRSIILWDLSFVSWQECACRIANRDLNRGEWETYLGTGKPYRQTCGNQRR